jgi:hypothetical protein
MKKYKLFFWAASIPFALLSGFVVSRQGDPAEGWVIGFSVGILCWGFLFFMFYLYYLLWLDKQRAFGKTDNDKCVRQLRKFELNKSYDEAFGLCVQSLGCINNCCIEKKDNSKGEIIATTLISLKSYGEMIKFHLSRIDTGNTQVVLSSKPIQSWRISDFGKNLENVKRIMSYFNELGSLSDCNESVGS